MLLDQRKIKNWLVATKNSCYVQWPLFGVKVPIDNPIWNRPSG